MFLKENWIKIIIAILFILFIFLTSLMIFRKKNHNIVLKIKEKIDELKLKTNEISIDRRIIKEIKQYELKQSEESSQKFIEEFEEINQISEFEERVRKKVRLYGKIE